MTAQDATLAPHGRERPRATASDAAAAITRRVDLADDHWTAARMTMLETRGPVSRSRAGRTGSCCGARCWTASGASRDPSSSCTGPQAVARPSCLAQWAQSDPRPTCWLTIRPAHSDPVLLVADLARALAAVHPSGPLASLPRRVGGSDALRSLARLSRALDEAQTPTLIVVDDAHRIRDGRLSISSRPSPTDSRRRAVSRSQRERDSELPVARWQLADRVLIVEQDDLRLDVAECGSVLEALGVAEAKRLAPDVQERTEGWVAGDPPHRPLPPAARDGAAGAGSGRRRRHRRLSAHGGARPPRRDHQATPGADRPSWTW